jgi:hypothetical protein
MGASLGVIANKSFEMGINTIRWSAAGHPPGVYLYSLQAGVNRESRFMIVK